jgi:hypothetical protein
LQYNCFNLQQIFSNLLFNLSFIKHVSKVQNLY